ncbi:MAG TPA: YSC84-related protein [Verrucomicrobiae bacterium]|nr:YSC84-related protein [Verrucomicrobiae bacterium]
MRVLKFCSIIVALVAVGICPSLSGGEKTLDDQAKDAILLFKSDSTNVAKLFDTAYGYAVLPSVGKGAVGIGAAAGDGQVYEQGRLIGTCRMTQVTIGAQLGGQAYAEVIFFETKGALDGFKANEWAMSAGMNAVAAAESASADAKYKNGVLVYTIAKSGLMFEASVGGQKFRFTPLATR